MNKIIEYKNVDEFIKKVFPNTYLKNKGSNDYSLEAFMRKDSENFKLKINDIINNNKTSNGA